MAERSHALVQRTIDGARELVLENVPAPRPASHELLVKVSHVAQNPTDGELLSTHRVLTASLTFQSPVL